MSEDPVETIVRDPEWLAHRFDPTHDAIHFRRVSRDAHRRATFLTDQYLPADGTPIVLGRREAIAAAQTVAGPIHFIFHSAFCCSTLIARALDHPGWAMGLKEPVILNDIVGWRRRGATPVQLRSALDDALTLLARPFAPGEAIVVKPSNVVNGLAMTMMELRPDARALLLYAPLPEFLASIARKGLDGRLFVRELFLHQLKDGLVRLGFDQNQLFGQTDLQIAAAGWLVQMQLFGAMIGRFGSGRVRTAPSDALLAEPRRTIGAIASLFALSREDAVLAAAAEGPAFTTHSKDGAVFDALSRAAAYAEATRGHADEIGKVLVWAEAVARQAGIAPDPEAGLFS